MSAILRTLGGLVLVLMLIGAAGGGFAYHKARALQHDGVQFVETNVPLIVENWDANEVFKRAAPEFLAPSVREGLPKVFQYLSRLGKLRDLGKPKGQVVYANFQLALGDKIPMPKLPDPVWAEFLTDGEFEGGSATIKVDLVRRDGTWQILGFWVNASPIQPGG